MSVWLWILLGMVGFFAASVLVGLFLAAILAKIGREACALVEFEPLNGLLPGVPESSEAVEEHAVSARSTGLRLT
jgi:hypothetical protein